MDQPESTNEAWVAKLWRPAMAWQYFIICMFDFLVAPIMYATINLHAMSDKIIQWDPLTLRGGGLYHLAMGAIIGVTAWSRGQEKMVWMNWYRYQQNQQAAATETPVEGEEDERVTAKETEGK